MTGTIDPAVMIRLSGVNKTFVMHLRGGAQLPAVRHAEFTVHAGECVALDGPSGSGKSSILKMIFGNYRADAGEILVREGEAFVDVRTASPRDILRLRRNALGYVSQFLRAIPRVGCFDLVVASARESGCDEQTATERTRRLLTRLNVPERLWALPPATFSGGEQQRINIACGFAPERPIMLLDEPTASLDQHNSDIVIGLIDEAKARGAALVGIFHDPITRQRAADRSIDVRRFTGEILARA